MKIVIDIPEEDYKFIKDLQSLIIGGRGSCKTIQKNVINAIRNGTPYEERLIEDDANLTVDDFEDDTDFMENINMVSTEELFNCLEYYGCDGYYAEIHNCVIEELKKRVR